MPWPTRADGTNKTVGEMTPDERRRVFAEAAARLQREFSDPLVQQKLAAALRGDNVNN